MCQRAIGLTLFAVLYATGCRDRLGSPSLEDDAAPDILDEGGADVANDEGPDISDEGGRDVANDGGPGALDQGALDVTRDGGPASSDDGALDAAPETRDPPDTEAFCKRSPEREAFVTVRLSDGSIEACDRIGLGPGFSGQLSGVVRDDQQDPAARNSITVDTCAGGCNVVVGLTGSIPFAVRVGSYVEVEYSLVWRWQCRQFLRISNLPEWNGQRNPLSDASSPYLIVSSGFPPPTTTELMSTGITVETLPTDCIAVDGGGFPQCAPRLLTNSAFKFSHPSSAPITVMQATEQPWLMNGRPFVVRDHMSYRQGGCDDFGSWGFSIAAR